MRHTVGVAIGLAVELRVLDAALGGARAYLEAARGFETAQAAFASHLRDELASGRHTSTAGSLGPHRGAPCIRAAWCAASCVPRLSRDRLSSRARSRRARVPQAGKRVARSCGVHALRDPMDVAAEELVRSKPRV